MLIFIYEKNKQVEMQIECFHVILTLFFIILIKIK